jgi:hypothetical protein
MVYIITYETNKNNISPEFQESLPTNNSAVIPSVLTVLMPVWNRVLHRFASPLHNAV